jgi:hypothetical protein
MRHARETCLGQGQGDGQESSLDSGCSPAPVPILINFNEVEIGAVLTKESSRRVPYMCRRTQSEERSAEER